MIVSTHLVGLVADSFNLPLAAAEELADALAKMMYLQWLMYAIALCRLCHKINLNQVDETHWDYQQLTGGNVKVASHSVHDVLGIGITHTRQRKIQAELCV